jgi:hypothetical protein
MCNIPFMFFPGKAAILSIFLECRERIFSRELEQ